LNLLTAAYGTGARLRRMWYARHPGRVGRLDRPVISIGNLTVGGSGKTPIVAALAAMLHDAGERPVVLSRGYARRDCSSATLVVTDGARILEPAERSGDEPQMLARMLRGIPVVVGANRFVAGTLAQSRFDCTVFVLDDGFQHVQLARDIDLLVASAADLQERLLPVGRLREPLRAAAAAHAVLVDGDAGEAMRLGAALHVPTAFAVTRTYERPRRALPFGEPLEDLGNRVVAVAGIARPERFFAAVRAQGWEIARELRFRDHHWFSFRDIGRIAEAARESQANFILTTEKDAVRLHDLPSGIPPVAYLPMRVSIEPPAQFMSWVMARLEQWGRRSFFEDTVINK
jgi:tetraacyldisaccharide 4'-kinase